MAKPLKVNLAKVRAGQSVWLRRGDDFTKVRVIKRGFGFGFTIQVELPEKDSDGQCKLYSVCYAIPFNYRHKPMEWVAGQSNLDYQEFYNRVPREYKRGQPIVGRSIFGYDRSAFVIHKRHSTGVTPDTLVVQPMV